MPIQLKFNNTDLQDIFSSRTGNNTYGSKYNKANVLDVGSGESNWSNSYTKASNVNFKVNNTDFAAIFYPVYYDVTSNVTVTMPSWASKVAFVVQAQGGNGDGGFTDYWTIVTIPVPYQVAGFTSVQFSNQTSRSWTNQLSFQWSHDWSNQNSVAWHNDTFATLQNSTTVYSQQPYAYIATKYWRDCNFYRNNRPQTWKQEWSSGFKQYLAFGVQQSSQQFYGRFNYTVPANGLNYSRTFGTDYGENYGRANGTNYGRTYAHFYYANYNTNYTRSGEYSQGYSGSAGGGGGCIGGVYNIQGRGNSMTISYNFNNSYSNIIFNDTGNSVTAYNGNNANGNGNSGMQYYAYPGAQNTSTDSAGGGGSSTYNGPNFVNMVASSGSGGQTTWNGASSTSGGGSGIANNSTIQTNFLPTFSTDYGRGGNGSTGGGGGGTAGFIRYWFIK